MNEIVRIARLLDAERDEDAREEMRGVLRGLEEELKSMRPRRIAPSTDRIRLATAEAG